MNIQIKNRSGSLIFEHDGENNTIKKTVEKAVKDRANLDRANLYRANLDGANLYRANLFGANLDRANLFGANLFGASLNGANLNGANLNGANLDRANLNGAKNLDTAILPIHCKWSVSMIGDKIKMGCKIMAIPEWDSWFDGSEELETKRGTKEFAMIEANYKAVKTYMEHMNKFKEEK